MRAQTLCMSGAHTSLCLAIRVHLLFPSKQSSVAVLAHVTRPSSRPLVVVVGEVLSWAGTGIRGCGAYGTAAS